MYQHMKFDHTFFNGIFKTELNINLRKVRSKERAWSILVTNLKNLYQYASTYEV